MGVTNSTISLIEQNKVSPSISSLKKVLDGIPISLADFFTMDLADTADSPFYGADDLPGRRQQRHPLFPGRPAARQRQMCILREVMPPGSDTGETMLSHDGEEGGVIVQGQVEADRGRPGRVLGPGEAYYFESRTPHRFRNVGRTRRSSSAPTRRHRSDRPRHEAASFPRT